MLIHARAAWPAAIHSCIILSAFCVYSVGKPHSTECTPSEYRKSCFPEASLSALSHKLMAKLTEKYFASCPAFEPMGLNFASQICSKIDCLSGKSHINATSFRNLLLQSTSNHGLKPTLTMLTDPSLAACGDDDFGQAWTGLLWGDFFHYIGRLVAQTSNAPPEFVFSNYVSHDNIISYSSMLEGATIHGLSWQAMVMTRPLDGAYIEKLCSRVRSTLYKHTNISLLEGECYHGAGHGAMEITLSMRDTSLHEIFRRYSTEIPLHSVHAAENLCLSIGSYLPQQLCAGGAFHHLFKYNKPVNQDWTWPCELVKQKERCYYSLFTGQIALYRWMKIRGGRRFPDAMRCPSKGIACVLELSRYAFIAGERSFRGVEGCGAQGLHVSLPTDVKVFLTGDLGHGPLAAWCGTIIPENNDNDMHLACLRGSISQFLGIYDSYIFEDDFSGASAVPLGTIKGYLTKYLESFADLHSHRFFSWWLRQNYPLLI